MQAVHCFVGLPTQQIWNDAQGFVDGVVDILLFFGWGFAQHESANLIGTARVADTDAQAGEILVVTQFADDVSQPVVSAVTATLFEFGHPWRQIELIVGNQYTFRWDFEKVGKGCNGLAADIHKCGGYQESDIMPADSGASAEGIVFGIVRKAGIELSSQPFYEPGTSVVSGLFILLAWIPQANDEIYTVFQLLGP